MKFEQNDNSFIYILSAIFIVVISAAAFFAYPEYVKYRNESDLKSAELQRESEYLSERQSAFSEKFGLSNSTIDLTGKSRLSRTASAALSEPCDWVVISNLAQEFVKADQRRNAAILYEYFDRECTKANNATWQAANIYEQIGDFEAGLRAITRFIEDTAENPDGYYLRARLNEKTGTPTQAISDYLTTISLIGDPSKTSYGVFRSLSATYESEGMFCEAATALQIWTDTNGEQDNSQVNHLISSIRGKGDCTNEYASGKDTFRHGSNASGVIYADVFINGQKGRFIVDTGAAVVSLSASFAKRLKLSPSKNSEITLSTANGLTVGNRVTLDNVKIGKVTAKDVQGVMMQKEDAFSRDFDGLLGRSFLARFDVKFERGRWSIASRK